MKLKSLLPILLVALVAAGCSRQAKLTVTNASATTLTDIAASGSGFSISVTRLAPGEQHQAVISAGEGFKLAFDAGGKHYSTEKRVTIEGGTRFSATVTTNLSVESEAILRF